jgi:DNA-binding transcriptional regulator YiaG
MKNWTREEIKELRNRMGLSQALFGERIGTTRQYVYYMERGERIPSKTLMLLLSYIDNENEKGKEVKKHGKRKIS